MTTTSADPRYQALATRAAGILGTSSADVIRAILAQWSCEVGGSDPWPVPRNNPGNVSKCAVVAGIPYTVAANAPNGPTCPIVTFATPDVGAQAYAEAIATFSRYRTALLDARAGNGAAFLQAVCLAGWGTSLSCASGVYSSNGGTAIVPVVQPVSSTTPTDAQLLADADVQGFLARLASIGIPTELGHAISQAEAAAIVSKLYGVTGEPGASMVAAIAGQTVRQLATAVYTGQRISVNTDPITAVANAIGALPGEVQTVAVYLGKGLLLSLLAGGGLYLFLTGGAAAEPS